ncbi:MAG: hypothetical protein LBB61_00170 [Treponema sp.]|nr:hypothetical protein [Treponema sp.]
MKKNVFFMAMPVIALALGMAVLSCGNGTTNGTTGKVFIYSDFRNAMGQNGDKLCVIDEGKVKFYGLMDDSGAQITEFWWGDTKYTWGEIKEYQLILPAGYKGAFIGPNNNLCVVVDGKVKSYHNFGDGWIEYASDFALPSGYKGLFGLGFNLCVLVGDKIMFYEENNAAWKASLNYEAFTLPSGFSSVFVRYEGDTPVLYVTIGDKIRTYQYGNGWEARGSDGWDWKEQFDAEEASLPSSAKLIGYFHENDPDYGAQAVVADDRIIFGSSDIPEFTIPK